MNNFYSPGLQVQYPLKLESGNTQPHDTFSLVLLDLCSRNLWLCDDFLSLWRYCPLRNIMKLAYFIFKSIALFPFSLQHAFYSIEFNFFINFPFNYEN